MRIFILTFLTTLYSVNSFGQELIMTKYYDVNWNLVDSKKFQTKREVYKVNDSLFLIKDYFKDKYLEMEGQLSSIEPEIENGEFIFYRKNGKIYEKVIYKNGEPMATCLNFLGQTKYNKDYNFYLIYDTVKIDKTLTPIDNDNVIAEQIPKFNDGEIENFRYYIVTNIRYPSLAFKYKKCGKVYVRFRIDETGQVSDVKIAESVDKALDKEAAKLIRNSPKWTSGFRARITFPVSFVLSNDGCN